MMQATKTRAKRSIISRAVTGAIILLVCSPAWVSASDQSDVRAAVQRIFDQLKNAEYESLYDSLPASARSRISRERLVQGLQRTHDNFQLQRIEIGQVRVSGNLAVVDTTMYAHVAKPFDADGKLVVQQYLVREDGNWKVATGDTATINRFLQSNPSFAKRFPIKQAQAFVYQNDKWVPIPLGQRRSR
jgi:hypothetical protein